MYAQRESFGQKLKKNINMWWSMWISWCPATNKSMYWKHCILCDYCFLFYLFLVAEDKYGIHVFRHPMSLLSVLANKPNKIPQCVNKTSHNYCVSYFTNTYMQITLYISGSIQAGILHCDILFYFLLTNVGWAYKNIVQMAEM